MPDNRLLVRRDSSAATRLGYCRTAAGSRADTADWPCADQRPGRQIRRGTAAACPGATPDATRSAAEPDPVIGHRHGRASAWRPRRPAPRVARSDHRRIHLDRPGWTWLPPLWLRAGAVSR